jgi:hypothetical protein
MLDDIVQCEYSQDAELTLQELNAIYYQQASDKVALEPYVVVLRLCDMLVSLGVLGKGYDPRYRTIYEYLHRKMHSWPTPHSATW